MAYQPVGSKRKFIFLIFERFRIFIYKAWYGPRAMSRLLATTEHPVMVLEYFGATIEHPVYLRPSLQIINATNATHLKLAKGVHIGEAARIDLSGSVVIGENSVLGQGSLLITHQNMGRVSSPFAFENMNSALIIEPNVFISVNVIILCTTDVICEGTMIGAQSLVKESVLEAGVYVGNPLKKIR